MKRRLPTLLVPFLMVAAGACAAETVALDALQDLKNVNVLCLEITDPLVRQAAEVMLSSGMADVG